jgi:DNA primase
MFPIHSVTGRVLGFGGRTLFTDKKIAKYFNSPESVIYNKSEILYGLHFAKGDIVKYDNCFLCEGYTDVISMHQAGICHSVSSSGTSLTKDQIKLVRRYTNNITILYDGDAAGIKASFRGIDLILEEGMNVKVVLFPDGEDPDSYSKKVSSSELELYIKEHMQDFISFKADILLKDGENDPLKRADLIKEVAHSVALIPDQITRTVYTQQVAQVFGISEQVVNNELLKLRKNVLSKQLQEPELRELPVEIPTTSTDNEIILEKPSTFHGEFALIRIMVKYGAFELKSAKPQDGKEVVVSTSVIELICNELFEDELTFSDPLFNKIHHLFLDGLKDNTVYQTSYLQRHEDQEIVKFVSDIESSDIELSHQWLTKYGISTTSETDNLESTVIHVIYSFKFAKVEEKIHAIRQVLNSESVDDEEKMNHLIDQIRLENVKKMISEKLGRIILK